MNLQGLITVEELRGLREKWRRDNARVAFVPTMGALHAGHLALVTKARETADRVIVSIFVNPTQFGPNEDFGSYPRTLQNDLALLEGLDVEAVFMPNAAEIYPDGFQTYVTNDVFGNVLCGRARPGHFRGVLTVVLKLFNLVSPHVVVFGKKDYQQLSLIQRMVTDLALGIEVVGHATERERDGLAMSSRNVRLSGDGRKVAAEIFRGLQAVKKAFDQGETSQAKLVTAFHKHLHGFPAIELEYIEIRKRNLDPFVEKVHEDAVVLTAAKVGGVRLIDNLELDVAK